MMKVSTSALVLLSLAQGAAAQLPNSSTRSVALGGGYTASARGFEAIAWNPALLAMPGKPGFSLNIAQVTARLGSNSYGLGDFQKYRDVMLTTADKDTLLDLVRQGDPNRPLSLTTGVGVSSLALSIGSFAASLSAAADIQTDVSSDAIELALFGNVTRKGAGQAYTAAGSGVRGWGGSTLALAYGMRLPTPVGALAAGATLKINRGIGTIRAMDLNTTLQTNPVFDANVGFHALATDVEENNTSNGSGFGLDLGGAYDLPGGLRLGLVLENILTSMSWKDDNLLYYRKQFRVTANGDAVSDTTISDLEEIPYNEADPLQKALYDSMTVGGTFPTRIRVGANYNAGMITIAGGAIIRAKAALDFNAAQQVSVGAELRLIPFIPLRAGFSTDFTGGATISGGLGLKLGPVRLDAALANTASGDHKGFEAALGVSIM